MKIILEIGQAFSLATLALCFGGVAFADGNSEQVTEGPAAAAQRPSDPGSLEKVSTSEYARAHQFTDGASENTPELQAVEASKDVQISDAWQFTAKADATNRPVRVFEVVSHNSSFAPIGERVQLAGNGEIAASASLIDNPEYYILLICGMVLLVIIAFGRRSERLYICPR